VLASYSTRRLLQHIYHQEATCLPRAEQIQTELMVETDDYYYDGFVNYVPKTHDPGPWMLIGVCIYSICCVLILPVLVILGKRREKRLLDRKKKGDGQLSQVDTPRTVDSCKFAEEIELVALNEDTNQVAIVDLSVSPSAPKKRRPAPNALPRLPQEVRILECNACMYI